jgi:hypothetical protein
MLPSGTKARVSDRQPGKERPGHLCSRGAAMDDVAGGCKGVVMSWFLRASCVVIVALGLYVLWQVAVNHTLP